MDTLCFRFALAFSLLVLMVSSLSGRVEHAAGHNHLSGLNMWPYNIHVHDNNGDWDHAFLITGAMVQFTPGSKIGTVVITDLRYGSFPTGLKKVNSMTLTDLILGTTVSEWSVTNGANEIYSSDATEFYLKAQEGTLNIYK